jgi:hypothetical protein
MSSIRRALAARSGATWIAASAMALLVGGRARLGAQEPTSPPVAVDTAARPGGHTTEVSSGPPLDPDSARPYRRMTLSEYAGRILGPRALGSAVVSAGIQQLRQSPKEWSKDWRGYDNRLTSRLGAHAIAQTFVFGVSLARDERLAVFTRCNCTGDRPRLAHALLTPFRVDTPDGTRLSVIVPASEIVGSVLITGLRPGGFNVKDGLVGGATSLLVSSAFSTVREFWPWHRRPPGI